MTAQGCAWQWWLASTGMASGFAVVDVVVAVVAAAAVVAAVDATVGILSASAP